MLPSDSAWLGASRRVVVAGHSHMAALVGEIYSEHVDTYPIEGYDRVFALRGMVPRNDLYWSTLGRSVAGQIVALIWGGNEHNLFYFFEDQPFDFVSRHIKKLISGFNVIPQRMVKEKFHQGSMKQLDEILHDLSSSPDTVITVLGTPPPKKDNNKLRSLLEREPHFQHIASSLGEDLSSIRIRPPHVRLKLWFLLQDMLADSARRVGGRFIGVPPEVQDAQGFLKEEFWQDDVTHANRQYGAVMLRHVMRVLNESELADASL